MISLNEAFKVLVSTPYTEILKAKAVLNKAFKVLVRTPLCLILLLSGKNE